MTKILSECSAFVCKSLRGLDYFAAEGAQAFDDLSLVLEQAVEVGASKERVQGLQEVLKAGKLYLKGDFKVIFFSVQYELILINHKIGAKLEKILCTWLMENVDLIGTFTECRQTCKANVGSNKNECKDMDVISWVIQSQLIESQYHCSSRVSILLGLLSLGTYADCLVL